MIMLISKICQKSKSSTNLKYYISDTILTNNVTNLKILSVAILSLMLVASSSIVFADASPSIQKPKFIDVKNIYNPSTRATAIHFDVKAVDGDGRLIAVQCDKISGQIFKEGITRVNCIAEDVYKNIIRTHFIVIVGYESVDIPKWFKQPTKFWLEKGITDQEYFTIIEYLMKKQSIIIPSIGNMVDKPSETIPSWIIVSSKLWTDNRLGDHEFSIVLKWFIENNYVKHA